MSGVRFERDGDALRVVGTVDLDDWSARLAGPAVFAGPDGTSFVVVPGPRKRDETFEHWALRCVLVKDVIVDDRH